MNTKTSVLDKIKESIADIENRLAVQVLDGTPYLLMIEVNGVDRVYGHWDTGTGFLGADVVPSHLCGSVQMSQQSAQRNAAAINQKGQAKAFYMRWRAFLEARLEKEKAMLERI